MSESTPEPTQLETVARLAAEAAVAAMPDLEPRVAALEESVGQILQALQTAAGPEGNGAKLAARLDRLEAQAPPDPLLIERLDTIAATVGELQTTLERTQP